MNAEEIVERAMDGIHWNDFDMEHPGQRVEIEAAINRALKLAIPDGSVVVRREDLRTVTVWFNDSISKDVRLAFARLRAAITGEGERP